MQVHDLGVHSPWHEAQQGPWCPQELLNAWHAQKSIQLVDLGCTALPSVHELGITLCPCDNDVHPDAHGLS